MPDDLLHQAELLPGVIDAALGEKVLGQVETGVHLHLGDGSIDRDRHVKALLVPLHGLDGVANLSVDEADGVEAPDPNDEIADPFAGGEGLTEQAEGGLVPPAGGQGVGLVPLGSHTVEGHPLH